MISVYHLPEKSVNPKRLNNLGYGTTTLEVNYRHTHIVRSVFIAIVRSRVLQEETMREGRRVPASACTWEGRQKADIGSQFVCPMPECRYSMRLMNLGRWSTRNKTVSDAVTAYRKIFENRQVHHVLVVA